MLLLIQQWLPKLSIHLINNPQPLFLIMCWYHNLHKIHKRIAVAILSYHIIQAKSARDFFWGDRVHAKICLILSYFSHRSVKEDTQKINHKLESQNKIFLHLFIVQHYKNSFIYKSSNFNSFPASYMRNGLSLKETGEVCLNSNTLRIFNGLSISAETQRTTKKIHKY